MIPLDLHPDRLFPADPATRRLARALYATVRDLPIVSPHGHTDPHWFADNEPFPNASALLIVPDHYVFRMLYSQGVPLEALGVPRRDGDAASSAIRAQDLAPVRRALPPVPRHADAALARPRVRHGVRHRRAPDAESADRYFDRIAACLRDAGVPAARAVRALQHRSARDDRSPLDPLEHHRTIRDSGWRGRVVTAYRPDPVVDPAVRGLRGERRAVRRADRRGHGNVDGLPRRASRRGARSSSRWARPSTDHGHPTARTARPRPRRMPAPARPRAGGHDRRARKPSCSARQMLTEMARMSVDDGLVHADPPGRVPQPQPAGLRALRPRQGRRHPAAHRLRRSAEAAARSLRQRARLTLILFTLDETTYARELAPLAGHYPALRLGPPWWFHDSSRGHAALPRADDRDGRLLQHRRLQRRHARVPVDPRAPRRVRGASMCRFLATARRRAPARRGRGAASSRPRSPTRSREGGVSTVARYDASRRFTASGRPCARPGPAGRARTSAS